MNEEPPLQKWTFQGESNERLEPLDDGKPGFRLGGLREVQGTFSGRLEDGAALAIGATGPVELYLYGPDPDIPGWKRWFYRVLDRIGWMPYPTVVLASGPATFDMVKEREDGEDIVFEGSFTKAGKWTFHE